MKRTTTPLPLKETQTPKFPYRSKKDLLVIIFTCDTPASLVGFSQTEKSIETFILR
jgi:hypothetical protein